MAHEPKDADLTARFDRAHAKRLNVPLRFVRWDYPADERGIAGYFKKDDSGWSELKGDEAASHATFKETARTAEYVELFDAKRTIWVRLGETEASFSNDQKTWNALCKGKAVETATPPTTSLPQR